MKIRECWRHRVNGEFNSGGFEATSDGIVFECWRPDRQGRSTVDVVGLSLDGEGRWEIERTGDTQFSVFGRYVYLGGKTALCLDIETGARVAERDFVCEVEVQPPSGLGPTYWVEPEGPLLGLHPTTLETLWEWEEGLVVHKDSLCWRAPRSITIVPLSQPLRAKETPGTFGDLNGWHTHFENMCCVVGLAEGGGRIGIDQSTGEIVWRGSEPKADPWVGFGPSRAYSTDGHLEAWDLRTGRSLWRRDFAHPIPSCPTEANGRVYVSTRDGTVHLLDAGDGAMLAAHRLKYRPSGSRYEPSPIVPWGDNRVLVGTQREIICLEVE